MAQRWHVYCTEMFYFSQWNSEQPFILGKTNKQTKDNSSITFRPGVRNPNQQPKKLGPETVSVLHAFSPRPVSYTHLTLPTKLSV